MEEIRNLAERIDTFAFSVDPYEYRDVYGEGNGVEEIAEAITLGGDLLKGIIEYLEWYLDDEEIKAEVQKLLGSLSTYTA